MKSRSFDLNPQTAKEIEECATIQGMRARLNLYSHYDPMTRSIFDSAHYRGLSGEDMMTWLAFEAMKFRETVMDKQLTDLMLNPMPPIVISEKS